MRPRLGAQADYLAEVTERAVEAYMAQLGLVVRPEWRPSKDLQKQLTQPLHQRALDKLLREGDAMARVRNTRFYKCIL